MTSAEHEHPVETIGADFLTPRSASAMARGDRTGVLMTPMPWEANTSSKLAGSLVSRSRITNLMSRSRSRRSPAWLRATWVTRAPVG